eukprot:c27324_g1_i1.p1 GENE.c27324_g1_i1~~c27324_g1_i1.p1  ORF type:complete len:339 (+),score=109.93 c27324_g1_i1:27-1043(+)
MFSRTISNKNVRFYSTTSLNTLNTIRLDFPKMIVGTYSWGDKITWKYNSSRDDGNIKETFFTCLEKGLNCFDTSDLYGEESRSEVLLGSLIREAERSGKQVKVSGKYMPWAWRLNHKKAVKESLLKTLDRLGQSKIHLYQLASFAPTFSTYQSLADGLADAYESGLIKYVGIANSSVYEVEKMHAALAKRNVPLLSNQIEFSLLRKFPETSGLVETCRKKNMLILSYSPLGMGRLTGKYSKTNPPPGGRRFGNQPMEDVDKIITELWKVGNLSGQKTPPQVALNYLITKNVIPIVGMREKSQVIENYGALGWNLTQDLVEFLDTKAIYGRNNPSWQHG